MREYEAHIQDRLAVHLFSAFNSMVQQKCLFVYVCCLFMQESKPKEY